MMRPSSTPTSALRRGRPLPSITSPPRMITSNMASPFGPAGAGSVRAPYAGAVSDLERVRQWVDDAGRITVLAGAGISTDSGIADFRGPNGLWTKNPEAEKMATLQFYVSDPELRKRAWRARLDHQMWQAEPN